MELGEIKMRSDYALYTVAIIFFIITGVAITLDIPDFERSVSVVTAVVLGLLFIGLGYYQRPKPKATAMEIPPAITVTPTAEEAETAAQATPSVVTLTQVRGIGEKRAEQLKTLGVKSVEDLASASEKDLAAGLKISPKITKRWIENAKKLVEKS